MRDARGWLSGELLAQSRFDEEGFTDLWTVALATYGVGDTVTTVALLWFSESVNEFNALVVLAVENFGLAGLVGLKLLAFGAALGVCLAGVRSDDPVLYYLPPAALSVVGGFVTAFNVRLFIG